MKWYLVKVTSPKGSEMTYHLGEWILGKEGEYPWGIVKIIRKMTRTEVADMKKADYGILRFFSDALPLPEDANRVFKELKRRGAKNGIIDKGTSR